MTIKNPEKFIDGALYRDFTIEQYVENNDLLLPRHDGVRIWATKSKTASGIPNYTIGMSADRCIFKINFSQPWENNDYRVMKVTVGIPARYDWNAFFAYWEYRINNKCVKGKEFGGSNIYSHQRDSQISELQAMQKTGWYWQQKDLPARLDLEETADRFLIKVLGWIHDPPSFENADLRPELVPEGYLNGSEHQLAFRQQTEIVVYQRNQLP